MAITPLAPEDFPKPWQKPDYETLRDCLDQLRVKPRIWNPKVSRSDIQRELAREEEATAYQQREAVSWLSSIVSSSLGWIADADQQEEIWNEASKRMAERCGRTAMGEITRSWPFDSEKDGQAFELTIREPPITGDSLGLKTWGSSYVLAQLLPQFAETSLSHLLSAEKPRIPVLELGSGTGLLGMAAASLWHVPVILTDMPDIMPNLIHNVEANRAVVDSLGGSIDTAPLVWGDNLRSDKRFETPFQYKLVIVADPIYDDDHPELLSGAIHQQLSREDGARALVMVPLRDETTKRLLSVFRDRLTEDDRQIICVEEDTVPGEDDWDEDDDSHALDCWWGVLRRSMTE
ncbi:hypothetical protein DL546_007214 [Coniochaeta pulveracea]|uniref:S-adenosylmethionine-dependent methyltransferase n=1 Tax=Coniochaeta pulveracea TaxID=177199 RepID=A0A420YK88_9PEZI|nr:hypothetical protein DL546_007214 [Coniochaeta pulveracea]